MRPRLSNAFTLIELLVVIAIIATLAAMLFPVFATARAQARKLVCSSNFRQMGTATQMYLQDFDDTMPLLGESFTLAPPNQLYGNLLQPYMKSYQITECPSDVASESDRLNTEVMPPTTPDQANLNLALKNDLAYNYQYLCPIVATNTDPFIAIPTQMARIGSPATTILGLDSVWNRDSSGQPYGGGNLFVDPPCRAYSDGSDSFPVQGGYPGFFAYGGWNLDQPLAANIFGGAWPWHGTMANVEFIDGHVKAMTMTQVAAGCDVKDNWGGVIFDKDAYLWDLN